MDRVIAQNSPRPAAPSLSLSLSLSRYKSLLLLLLLLGSLTWYPPSYGVFYGANKRQGPLAAFEIFPPVAPLRSIARAFERQRQSETK